jgi:hypothetical protein
MSLRGKGTTTEIDRAWVLGVERLAYTLLETARIRCEHLIRSEPRAQEALRGIHRDIGLAGYYMSSDFAPELRERSLAVAREEWGTSADRDARTTLEAMFEESVAASDTIATALAQASGDADLLHVVHLHVMSACESLNAQLAALPA